ncbi:Holliday junction resolvase RuvX [Acetobacter oeni]|uniref:Putative pre-16S rRNA nuclease n=1 Tax=Acetobacter oeni TaxID=304077 RepID=A0A511XM52_9PROT|nr:Holliday junction resolvase RuvX [Acetobacter oeni]NHO20022.1 Holliday junction resolvase RuvX [Acetobacter oeni]GBR04573.1 Holliday junction resolvase YqgF [Acetobacter oeni LMG 21952]GEN64018.1 putative pre-16S rRNA nuclease [Acetobacter oeni]
MALFNIAELMADLGPGQRLLGIDPGAKSVGLALSDVMRMVASPYGTLKREKLSVMAGKISAIIREHGVAGLVVGLPLSLDGQFGPAAQAARDWALALSGLVGVPVAMWDERLSSSAVNRALIDEADLSRKKRADVVDKMAAAYMLQGALDRFALSSSPSWFSEEE